MPIDTLGGPLIDYTSTLGDTAGIASGGAAAGLEGGLNPAVLPLTLLLSILPSLFKTQGQRDMSDLISYLRPTQPLYMSGNLPGVDQAAMRAVINQLSRTNNWGWPAGMGTNLDLGGIFRQNITGLAKNVR